MSQRRLLIDVGNTRVHIGRAEDERLVERLDLPGDAEGRRDVLRRFAFPCGSGDLHSVWIASVHPRRADAWGRDLDALGSSRIHRLESYRDLPLEVDLEHPETAGLDRLLNALAAHRRLPGAHVIADFGTALTIDVVDGEGVFRGGAITTGVPLMRRALGQAAQLPQIEFRPAVKAVGRGTEEAMHAGVYHGLLGAAQRLIGAALEEFGPAQVWLTGGDASVLADEIGFDSRLEPNLTLLGLLDVALD